MKEVGSQQKGGDHATNKIAMKNLPFKKRKPYLTSAAAALAVSNIEEYDQQPSYSPLLRHSPSSSTSSSPSYTPLLRYSPSSSTSSSPSSLPSVCSPEFIPSSSTSPRSCTPSTLFFNSPYKYNPMPAEYLSEYSPEYTRLSPHVGSYMPLSTEYDVRWTPTPRSTPPPLIPEHSLSSHVGTLLSLDFDITALLSPDDSTLWTPTALTQEYAPSSPVGTSLSLDLDILRTPTHSLSLDLDILRTPTHSLTLDLDTLRTPTHSSSHVGSIEYTQLYPEGTPWTPTALTQEYTTSFPVGTRDFDIPWTPTSLSSHVGSIEYTQLYPGGTPLTQEYMDSERSKEYDTPIPVWLFDH